MHLLHESTTVSSGPSLPPRFLPSAPAGEKRATATDSFENLTRWTVSMGKPRNKTQQLQDEGDRIQRTIINWLADKLTDPSCPLATEEMNHLRMVTAYFPEGRETADKIDRMFSDKPALRQAILLSTIVTCLDRLLA
jgi:hypothetical protein